MRKSGWPLDKDTGSYVAKLVWPVLTDYIFKTQATKAAYCTGEQPRLWLQLDSYHGWELPYVLNAVEEDIDA